MKYDLTNPYHRQQFTQRANALLRRRAACVSLVDESVKTVNQNAYLHVLLRILALYAGETEYYAKTVYLKQLACPDIFETTVVDKVTGEEMKIYRSVASLNKEEMKKVISRLRNWANMHDIYLPDASLDEEDRISFKTENDRKAYEQAVVETGRHEQYL